MPKTPERLTSPEATDQTPAIELREGVDFLNDTELDGRITEELKKLGIYSDDLLLIGYDGSQPSDDRTDTWAFTALAAKEGVSKGEDINTPYMYAWDCYGFGNPEIGVFDPAFFSPGLTANHYRLNPGRTQGDARLFTVKLVSGPI